jgi:flagellar basal-body rod protein FlgB
MDLNKFALFSGLSKRMAWLNQRTKVIAQNIANADTPNYQSHDLKPLSFKELTTTQDSRMTLASTRPGHFAQGRKQAIVGDQKKNREPYEVTPSGNSVVLEEQMMKLAENQMEYRLVTNLYKKNVGLLRMALGRR